MAWIGPVIGGLAGLFAGNQQQQANQNAQQNNFNQSNTLQNQQGQNAWTRLGKSGMMNPYGGPMGLFAREGIQGPQTSSMSIDPNLFALMMNPQLQYMQQFGGPPQPQGGMGVGQVPPWLTGPIQGGGMGVGGTGIPGNPPPMQRPIMPGQMRPYPGGVGGGGWAGMRPPGAANMGNFGQPPTMPSGNPAPWFGGLGGGTGIMRK